MTLDELILILTTLRDGTEIKKPLPGDSVILLKCPIKDVECWTEESMVGVSPPDFPNGPSGIIIQGGIGA